MGYFWGLLEHANRVWAGMSQEQFVGWCTAIAAGVGAVAASLEYGGRRVIQMWTEEWGKLQATDRYMYVALQAEMVRVRAELARTATERDELGKVVQQQLEEIDTINEQVTWCAECPLRSQVQLLLAEQQEGAVELPPGKEPECQKKAQ